MTCEWAHEEHRRIRGIDPSGLLLALAAASDKTNLSKEQTAEPVYLVNNALPLDRRAAEAQVVAARCLLL